MVMPDPLHRTRTELEAALDDLRASPREQGVVELIVRRPRVGRREAIDSGELDPEVGLRGDNWRARGRFRGMGDADPAVQVTLMNARAAALVAVERERWALAGDQLYVDFDLSLQHLPPGTRLRVGTALLEVSAQPHTGCKKFVQRFGLDAMTFVNSPLGRSLNLRGINARVIEAGVVRVGDVVKRLG